MIIKPVDPLESQLSGLYKARPDLFNEDQIGMLRETFPNSFKPSSPEEVAVGDIVEQFASGIVAGFTGLGDFADDPRDTYEALANNAGSLLGFLGILIPFAGEAGLISRGLGMGVKGASAVVRGAGAITKSTAATNMAAGIFRAGEGVSKVRSIPLLAGELGFKAFEKSSAGKMAAELLKGRPIMQQALESGMKLGFASGASELHEVYDEGITAPLEAFAFGALTGGVMDAGIGNLPFLKQRTTGHAVARAFAGSITQSATPLIVGQDPTADVPSLAYNAAIGAFFGYKAMDATTYKATKFIGEVASKPDYQNFLGRLRLGSIEMTREFTEFAKADPVAAARAAEISGDIFGVKRTMKQAVNMFMENIAPEQFKENVLIADIVGDLKAGEYVHIDGTPVSDRWKIMDITDEGVRLSNLTTKVEQTVSGTKLNRIPREREQAIPTDVAGQTVDFETEFKSIRNNVGEFFFRAIYDSSTGKKLKYNPSLPDEKILGYLLNMQERVGEAVQRAKDNPSVDPWEMFRTDIKDGVELALRTVTDPNGAKHVVPLSDADFNPLKEWFSLEMSKKELSKHMWDPFTSSLVDYSVSADGRFLKDTKGNLIDRYRVKYSFEDLPTGNVKEDGTPEFFGATEISDLARSHSRDSAKDYFTMDTLLDADFQWSEYGKIIRAERKKGNIFHSGEGEKHALLFTSKASDANINAVKAEMASIFERNADARTHVDKMAAENMKRLQITREEYDEMYYNNLHLWKALNKGLPLDTLLNAKRDDGKPAFLVTPLDYNKRMQVQIQKYTKMNKSVWKSPLPNGAAPRIVYVHDMEFAAQFIPELRGLPPEQLKKAIATLNDGAWIVPGPILDSFSAGMGMENDMGALKAFYRDSTPELGMSLHKYAIHRANDTLSKTLMDKGGLILAPASAAKQMGLRKMYHYHYKDGELVFSRSLGPRSADGKFHLFAENEVERLIPDSYEMDIEGLHLSTGTRDMAREHMNEAVRLAKQMLNDHTDPVVFKDFINHILAASQGDERGAEAYEQYIGRKNPDTLDVLSKNFENMDRRTLLELIGKDPDVERAFNKWLMRNDNTESFKQALEEGEFSVAKVDYGIQKLINAGVEGDGVLLSKLASEQYRDAYTRFFIAETLQPKLKHAGNAVLGAWSIDMLTDPRYKHVWMTDDYFMLGKEWGDLKIMGAGQKETTLRALWDEFAAFAIDKDGSLLPSSAFKGTARVKYDFYADLLTAVVPRVPLDSPSGAPALMFGGFADVKGGQLFVSSYNAKRMGGADHDIDKAFFYFGLPKSVKEFYRKEATKFEQIFNEELQNQMRGEKDEYIEEFHKNPLATFDPLARMAINRKVAVGRGQALPFAISASEKSGAFKQGIVNFINARVPSRLVNQRVSIQASPTTRVMFDPSFGGTYYYEHTVNGATTGFTLPADWLYGAQIKTAAINKAADAGKDPSGSAHPGIISTMIYTSRIDSIKIRHPFGKEGEPLEYTDPITLLPKGMPAKKLSPGKFAALQMYFGAPYEIIFQGRVQKGKIGLSRRTGDPYLRLDGTEEGTIFLPTDPDTLKQYSIKVNGKIVPIEKGDLLNLATAASYKIRNTDFGLYEDAMQKVYRKDRREDRGWGINDVVASLSNVRSQAIFEGTPLFELAKRVSGMYHDDNLITRIVPTGGSFEILDKMFAPYASFMKGHPTVSQLLGDRMGLPTELLAKRAEEYAKLVPFTASEVELREVARDASAEHNSVTDYMIKARLDKMKLLKPEEQTIMGIKEHYKDLGEDPDTYLGRLAFLKHERQRINDMLSERLHTMATVTRMIETITDMQLPPNFQSVAHEILLPVTDSAKRTKMAHFDYMAKRNAFGRPRSHTTIEDVTRAENNVEISKANTFNAADDVAKRYGVAPEVMREYAEAMLIGSLRYSAGKTKTSESSIGLRWASTESIRKFAQAYNESYKMMTKEVPVDGVRKLWKARLEEKRVTGSMPAEDAVLFMKVTKPGDQGVTLDPEMKGLVNDLTSAVNDIPSLKGNIKDFVQIVRKLYNVADLGDLTLPQMKGMLSFLKEMRTGNTIMSLIWTKVKRADLYKDVRFRDWLKFIWTIDNAKRAEAMAPIHEKLYNEEGILQAGKGGLTPLYHLTDEGKLRLVYADTAIPMSYVGRIANNFNIMNLRIQSAKEQHNRIINDTFGPLLSEVRSTVDGKDYKNDLANFATLTREVRGLYEDRKTNPDSFTERQEELLDYKRRERQVLHNKLKPVFDSKRMVKKDIEVEVPQVSDKMVNLKQVFGVAGAMRKREGIDGLSAFDAVLEGKKTAVSYKDDVGAIPGETIAFRDLRDRTVYGKVKEIVPVSSLTPEEFSLREGFALEDVQKNWAELSKRNQIVFDVLPAKKEMKTVESEEVVQGHRFHIRGDEKPYTASEVVRKYEDAIAQLLDGYARTQLHGTPDQWMKMVKRDKDGRFLLKDTVDSWTGQFSSSQTAFDVPYDILAAVNWFADIRHDAVYEKTQPFTMEQVMNLDLPHSKHLQGRAKKWGLLNGKSLGDAERFYIEYRTAEAKESNPEAYAWAQEFGRYFNRVHYGRGSYIRLLTGQKTHNQYSMDIEFATKGGDGVYHKTQTLMWQNQANVTGVTRGFFPHIEWDLAKTEAWALGRIEQERLRAPQDPAGAKARSDSLMNLYQKLTGEASMEDAGMNAEVAEAMVAKSMSTYKVAGKVSTPSMHSRSAFAPTYNYDLAVLQPYFDKLASARMKLFAAMQSKNAIYNFNARFEPMVKRGQLTEKYRDGWEQFMRLFVRDAMNYPSIFPKELLNNENLNLRRTPYYWLSDHAWVNPNSFSRKVYNTLFRTASLTPVEKANLAVQLGRPVTDDDEKRAREAKYAMLNDFGKPGDPEWSTQAMQNFKRASNAMRRFSEWEGRWETATLLFHPKTAVGNIYGGSTNNIVWNGMKAFRDAQSLDVWKNIAVKSRDGLVFESMDDVYRWWESTGAVSNQMVMEGSWATEFKTPQEKTFLAEAVKLLGKNGRMTDEGLYDLAKKHGLDKSFVDKSAFFMKKSERFLRIHAGLAGYLRAREQFSPMDLPLNTPFLVDMGIKSTQLTQFMYDAPNRPAFSRTNLGRVYSRFKVWSWASNKFQRDVFSEARFQGYNPYSVETQRLQRMMTANVFALSLATMVPYSIFDFALPSPISYWQDAARFFFGDSKEREAMYFGNRSMLLQYPLNPLNELMPPLGRLPRAGYELFQSVADSENADILGQYTFWSVLPYGRMSRDVIRAMRDPAMAFDFMVGVPTHRIQYGLPKNKE